MEIDMAIELEAAIARRMPAARRIFGLPARMRWRGGSVQVGFHSEYGFHVRGEATIPSPYAPHTLTRFRDLLDHTTASAIDSVRRLPDDPAPK